MLNNDKEVQNVASS